MENKDYFIIALGVLGWGWGIIQFRLNRKYQKDDKAIDKKFEVYSSFMNKMDEMNLEMRKDPNGLIKFSQELYPEIICGDEERINKALINMNDKLLEIVNNSMQPMLIVNQELNKLRLVASDKLLPKIDEYKTIVNQFTDEFQTALDQMKISTNLEANSALLEKSNQYDRNEELKRLWQEIESLMRAEIGFYNK